MALEPDTGVVEYIASIMADKRFDELDPAKDYDFGHLPIDIFTKDQIRTAEELLSALKTCDRYDLVIIDHVGYFVTDTNNTTQSQSNMMKRLSEIATTRQTAVLAIAHLNKTLKAGKIPSMNNISGSGAFKQDSTDVWILFKELDPMDKTKTKYKNTGSLIVAKSKNSASGPVEINFGVGRAGISEVGYQPTIPIYMQVQPVEEMTEEERIFLDK